MKSVLVAIWVILFVVIVAGIYYYSTYNTLLKADKGIEKKWETLNSYLEKKADVIINIKGFMMKMNEDNSTQDFGFVDDAVKRIAEAKTKKEKMEAARVLEDATSKMLSFIEKYPQLKANDNFTKMIDKLEEIDKDLKDAIKEYNELISKYNKRLSKFPLSVIAPKMGFKPKEMFKIDASQKKIDKDSTSIWFELCVRLS